MTPTFVVGTGRCGSTMLSNLLAAHPDLLSLSELFAFATDLGGRIAQTFPEGTLDAPAFWAILGVPLPKQSLMLRHGVAMDEVLYRPGPGRRFTAEAGVPALLQTTLPHLTPDPDALFDEVRAFVLAQPPATAPAHYARLFAWLTERFGKRTWVERSGGSLRVVRRLAAAFPGARFVHLVRDGRGCALSMSRHLGFRMAIVAMQMTEILGVDPFESPDRTWVGDLPDELEPFLPESFDAAAFRAWAPPLPLAGHYWSGEIEAGLRELAELPEDHVLTLRYEDFLDDPVATITRLVTFIGDPPDEAWVRRVAASVRRAPPSWQALAPAEQRALEAACRPGFAALGALYPDAPR